MKAQAARRQREQNAMLMSADQWSRIYGRPVPGCSRTMAQLNAANQLNAAQGRVYASSSGPEVAFGPEPKEWR